MEMKHVHIILSTLGFAILIFASILFYYVQKDINSVTLWVIFSGTCILYGWTLFYLNDNKKVMEFLFGKTPKKFEYHLKFFEVISIIFSAFIVGLALLWALFNALIQRTNVNESLVLNYDEFQNQTLLLIIFFIYLILTLWATIGNYFKKPQEQQADNG